MSTDSDRRRDLRRALLDGVVDAQLGAQCGGSAARNELVPVREDLRRHNAEAIRAFDLTIARSAA